MALGGCFVFNTMYGAFAVVYLIAVLLTTESLRGEWKRWLGWMMLGIALGAPGWMPTLLAGRQPYIDESAWRKGDWIFRKRVCELDDLLVDEATVLRLTDKYRIDYWSTSKETPTSLPIVYQDKTIKVVRVTPSTAEEQSDSRMTNP